MQYVIYIYIYIYTVWDINCTLFLGDWLLGCYFLVIGVKMFISW